MNKKNNLKDIFEDTFNIEKNHEEIFKKINKNSKKRGQFGYILVPLTCTVLLCLTLTIVVKKFKGHESNDYQTVTNIIKYNTFSGDNYYSLDIDGRLEQITEEEILRKYPYLRNVELLKDVNISIEYNKFYASSNKKNIEEYQKQLGDFIRVSDETNEKYALIFLSKTERYFKRCQRIDLDSLEDSIINNIKVKLIKEKENSFIAIFTFDNTYLDIELTNIKEADLIKIITSLTSKKVNEE